MTKKNEDLVFYIIDNEGDKRHPWALMGEDGTVLLVSHRKSELVDYAFDKLNATSVKHNERLP